MKKKVILKRIFHRGKWRYAIKFDKDSILISKVRQIAGAKWSQTNVCWYADCNESVLKNILTAFRGSAEIDISEIVSKGENFDPVPEPDTKKPELASHPFINTEERSDIEKSINEEDQADNELLVENESPDQFYNDTPYPMTIKTIRGKEEETHKYGPVKISINEAEGQVVIKFLGRYNQEWIKELRSYRKTSYDEHRKEWYVKWSQLTVDSLSDYFSSEGATVIVIKNTISPIVKEKRTETGAGIRKNTLSQRSKEAIEMVRSFLEEKRYSVRTIDSYASHLELFFKYYHEKDPSEITEADISSFVDDFIIRLGYSASYQNLVISSVKMYYSLTNSQKLRLTSIQRPRRSKALPKVFSKEEVMMIFGATRNNKHKLILWLIYSCGLRRGEVIKIKLSDLDRDRGLLHIREGKGNVDRQVPIPQKVWEKIDLYIGSYKPSKYLFEGQSGGKYSVESVYSVFKQSLKRAGIKKDVGVHCLRHSYATHLHESGLDIRYIQELLGHKSSRTTEIYTHVSRRNLFAIRSPIEDMDI